MLWYKFRAYGLYYLALLFGKLLGISIPPIPSVFVVIERKKKILVIDLSYEDGYAFPGGIVEKNESLEDAVRREVFEETGLRLIDLRYFGSYYNEKNVRYGLSVSFIARTSGKLVDSREGQPKWVSINKLQQKLVYKDNQMALEDYLRKK